MAVRNANILAARGLNFSFVCFLNLLLTKITAVADAIRTVNIFFGANTRRGWDADKF